MGFFTKEVGKKIVKEEEDQEEQEEEEDQDTYKIVAYCGDDEGNDSYDVIYRNLAKDEAAGLLQKIYEELMAGSPIFFFTEKPENDDEYWQGARVYNLAMYNSFEIKLENIEKPLKVTKIKKSEILFKKI